jgi:hypothetical protein
MYHEKTIDYFEAQSSLLSNKSRTMNFGDQCEELWQNLRVLKFSGQIAAQE